ncbi:tyrosine--tRNA ligase [Alienimonas californiensis]|uniref:Tyrosine--tRNA ligase n=1 Tax=Alienimonas californiensis TaxID=2527989 RepID=A0A517PEN5_9PLAN|nr:tyrosine--tRNA ligase [Alienimonas californiensis]QDT17829.1 Tyrosine--tRNA ligase [Alienimonas californiensis]
MSFAPVDEQLELLTRGVEKIVPEDELRAKLQQSRETNTPLRVKYGIDPTGIDMHLGHTVPLRKLRQFQELGHTAVVIIGDATARVGDPSGRDEARSKKLSKEEVDANAADYLNQCGKVIDLPKAEIHRNGDWFDPMGFGELLGLCGQVTVAQLLTREDFAKRYREEKPIFLHECLYPVMQAWDSVQIRADVELGGTEQLYTFMLARDYQANAGQPGQVGVMSPILVGTDGVKRMGKSLGNYIGIAEDAYEQMKKFMRVSDENLRDYLTLLTDLSTDEIETLLAGHPKEAKVTLAKSVIGGYHSAAEADEAADRWQGEIGGGGLPADIPQRPLPAPADGLLPAVDLLTALELVNSKSEGRRLIQQGGMKLGEDKSPVLTHDEQVAVSDGLLVWAGKKKFCRVALT